MLVSDIARSLNDGGQLDCPLLDFSKAFAKVKHRKAYLKFEHYGIRGDLINWIKNCLSNRTQKVIVKGKYLILLQLSQESFREQFWDHYFSSYT